MTNSGPLVFVWATGQLDNIGDSLLRRPYIQALSGLGPTCIWIKDADRAFLSGMAVDESGDVERSYRRWYGRAFAAAVRGRAIIAVNAGEVPVSRSGALRLASLGLLGAIARMRRGALLWLGVGVPPTRSWLGIPYRLTARFATHVWARDPDTHSFLKGSDLVPDWAFSLGTDSRDWSTDGRDVLSVTLRGDRPSPPEEWFTWLRQQASEGGLELVFVSQVGRDNERAAHLAREHDGFAVLFDSGDHAAQEAVVRDLYRRSRFLVGDRLHGLIVAASEGAIPVGWVPTSRGKIRRHFLPVRMDWVGAYEGSSPADLPSLSTLPDQTELARAMTSARRALDDRRASLQASSR
jgi:polysaccharide pyruvyl transferase WcaK-like protein